MEKIWIVRERTIWRENRPSDETTAYASEEMAKKFLIEKWEEIRGLYTDEEIEDEYICDSFGELINNNEDCYSIWIEEIDMFNE